jgi:hypothetical protein
MTSVIGKCTLIIIFYMLRDYNRLKDIEDRRRIAKEYKDTYNLSILPYLKMIILTVQG